MTGPLTETRTNPAWDDAREIRLSILIPFYTDDPTGQITKLMTDAPAGVEIIACDDGRPDAALNEAVADSVMNLDAPAALIISRINRGRAATRNRLARAARGRWLLFLDADMAPPPDFITRWLLAIENTRADALFGGYAPVQPDRATRVHARLAALSDGHDAFKRQETGASAVCSSNLAVRCEVMGEVEFDETYSGWGWEDVDWALRAAERFTLGHIDNPAGHAGLETVPALLDKFSRTGSNFARLLKRHPSYVSRPGAKLALTLRRMRMATLARVLGGACARWPLPDRIRVLGLKLFRAGVCAKAIRS